MRLHSQKVLGILALACFAGTAFGQTATRDYTVFSPPSSVLVNNPSGSTANGATWRRPTIGGGSLSNIATAVKYSTSTFTAPNSGSYTFTVSSYDTYFDKVAFLYGPTFNVNSQLTNLLVPGVASTSLAPFSDPLVFRATLTANTTYTLVNTGYADAPIAPSTNSGLFSNAVAYNGSLVSIPDNSVTGGSTTLSISSPETVTTVNSVTIKGLLHPYASDLTATLTNGVNSVTLFSGAGGSANFTGGDYTFNTSTSANLPTSGVITPGTYRSTGLFTPFNSGVVPLTGNWVLKLTDSRLNDVGSYTGLTLNITSTSAGVTNPTWRLSTGGGWTAGTNWTPTGVPDASGLNVVFGPTLTAAANVNLSSIRTVGGMSFESPVATPSAAYTINSSLGGGLVIVNSGVSTTRSVITVLRGTHTFNNVDLRFDSNVDFNAAAGSALVLTRNFATVSPSVELRMKGAGTLRLSGVGINNVIRLGRLDFDQSAGLPTATFDIQKSTLVLANQSVAELEAFIGAWYKAGLRNGPGLASSVAGTGSGRDLIATLGVISNDGGGFPIYNTLGGATDLLASDVIVRYTYLGDCDLNGKVDAFDLNRLMTGLGSGLIGWGNGDVNYDNVINATDLTLLTTSLNTQAAPFEDVSPTSPPDGSAAIPEPSMLAVVPIVGLLTGRRRR